MAISAKSAFWFRTYECALKAELVIELLRQTIKYRRTPLYLVIDSLPARKKVIMRDCVASPNVMLTLHYLPGHAPDLNPDVNASFLHELDERWALLGSVGWQQWSKFGLLQVGIDSPDPASPTKNREFKDTWHVVLGAQYKRDAPWRLDFGVAFDSEFQDNAHVSLMLPVNSAWRFGVGVQKQESTTFNVGLAAEYAYGGTLNVSQASDVPVTLGGRGDLVGTYGNTGIFFLGANFNWKFRRGVAARRQLLGRGMPKCSQLAGSRRRSTLCMRGQERP